jgi:hypothetical protein
MTGPCRFHFGGRQPFYEVRSMSTSDSRIYVGRLEQNRPVVFAVGTATLERLDPPGEGFGWGVDSADDALDLARVLLTDASGSEPPADACRRFADQILSRVPSDGFALPRETVNAWLRRAVPV